ncbi:hypothetical protein DFP73DRAFT_621865 [Morchella snyderi]|nr:hypothetical protein DFP73DRAFT_621865 [Morchella snyderi]
MYVGKLPERASESKSTGRRRAEQDTRGERLRGEKESVWGGAPARRAPTQDQSISLTHPTSKIKISILSVTYFHILETKHHHQTPPNQPKLQPSTIPTMSQATTHPSRRPQKRRKFGTHTTKLTNPTTAGTSISTLNKKIRDLTRFLAKKTTLPADVRLDSERALDAFRHELKAAKNSAREDKIAEKYRMVRFFERKKASRKLDQLVRRRRDSTEADEALERLIHEAEVEVNYTVYYPRGEKYISLFRDPTGDPKVVEKRGVIKRGIERQMEMGTLGAREEEVEEDEEKVGGKRKRNVEEKEVVEEEDDFFEFS